MVFRGLPNGKCLLGGCHKENAFYILAKLEMVFRDLTNGKWFSGLATREMDFGVLPHGKWFLGARHKEYGF